MASRGSYGESTKKSVVFVGRQSEMDLISRLLDGAKSGKGCFLGISGEPGIGKTRLAEAAAATARTKGFITFWGQCHDGQYIPPYWPWKEPLRGLLKMLPSPRGKAGRSGIHQGLSRIVSGSIPPAHAARAMPKPVSDQARLLILDSATALVRTISESNPLLLIMDNLHCADVPSIQLLEVVAREMRMQKVMIIGSYREPAAESRAEFRPAIGALASQEFFHGIPLPGLDFAAVSEYLRAFGVADPQAALVRAIMDRTEGNPLFVGEVARSLQMDGSVPGSTVDAQAFEKLVPQKIRLAILGQVQRLSAPCLHAMSLAALAGREFDARILRRAEPKGETGTDEIIEEAIAHGIIAEAQESVYRFTHALVQDVLIEQISGPRRSGFHRLIGNALERHYARDLEAHAGELARHFDEVGPASVGKAVRYYRLAGEQALMMHGFEDALEQLQRALELGEGKERPQDTARLLFGIAQAQHGVGKFKESVENYTRAFSLFETSGDIDNALRMLEQPLILAEKGADAMGLLQRAIGLAPGTLRAEALGGKYGLAVYHATGDYQRATALFERALLSARESGDRPQEIAALSNRGRIECDELHFARSHALEQEALPLARQDDDVWLVGMTMCRDTLSLLGLGRLAEAEREADLLLAFEERVHIRLWTAVILNQCFAVQRQKGALSAARGINEKAVAQGRLAFDVWNLADRALLEFEQGDPARAAQFLRVVEEEAPRADNFMAFHWEGWLTLLISLIAWVTGEPVRCEDAEISARALLARGGLRKGDVVHLRAGLGLRAVIQGDVEAAREHYTELLPFRGLVICPQSGITADHLLALLADTMEDADSARDHFDAALAFCRSHELTLELAYTCRDYAQFLLDEERGNDAARAVALCQEADQIARRCGLPHLIERLDALQDAHPRRDAAPAYPDSLSEREVEVLRLLAAGLSNALIGDRLFISPNTVANHVQKILEKTATANRTEAAMYAVRHRLLGAGEPRR